MSTHRKIKSFLLAVLVIFELAVADEDDIQHPARWISRRDFVFDTTNISRNHKNEQPPSELIEVEFGEKQIGQLPMRRSNESELKRKRTLKKVVPNNHHSHNNHRHDNDHNLLRGKYEGDHHNQNEVTKNQNEINIDADFMGHILRKNNEPKSLEYQDSKNTPTNQPANRPTSTSTKKPSKQPTTNSPTASSTQFPVANVYPSSAPTEVPTNKPTNQPTSASTKKPSKQPTTNSPTALSTQFPVANVYPSSAPTEGTSYSSWAPTKTSDTYTSSSSYLCPSNPNKSESLLDDLTLYYEVVDDNLCIRLEYDNEGWIGLGFSKDGRMVGSTAVIGLPKEKEAEFNPAYYSLNGMVETMVTPLPRSQQTLQEANIMQDNGVTILTFTKSLIDDELISFGENTFIFAAAYSNRLGYHDKRGAITLNLSR